MWVWSKSQFFSPSVWFSCVFCWVWELAGGVSAAASIEVIRLKLCCRCSRKSFTSGGGGERLLLLLLLLGVQWKKEKTKRWFRKWHNETLMPLTECKFPFSWSATSFRAPLYGDYLGTSSKNFYYLWLFHESKWENPNFMHFDNLPNIIENIKNFKFV